MTQALFAVVSILRLSRHLRVINRKVERKTKRSWNAKYRRGEKSKEAAPIQRAHALAGNTPAFRLYGQYSRGLVGSISKSEERIPIFFSPHIHVSLCVCERGVAELNRAGGERHSRVCSAGRRGTTRRELPATAGRPGQRHSLSPSTASSACSSERTPGG